jgi:hypothetical protein
MPTTTASGDLTCKTQKVNPAYYSLLQIGRIADFASLAGNTTMLLETTPAAKMRSYIVANLDGTKKAFGFNLGNTAITPKITIDGSSIGSYQVQGHNWPGNGDTGQGFDVVNSQVIPPTSVFTIDIE